jgi:hypothetical protein
MLIRRLYPLRFELFLATLLAILFGSLLLPIQWFENILSPILFLINLMIGVVFVSKDKRVVGVVISLLAINSLVYLANFIITKHLAQINFIRLNCFFIFYAIVTYEVIKQVTKASVVKEKAIFGLISGYISIGLLAFFMFSIIEYLQPESFSGLYLENASDNIRADKLLYFSYVTLLTIGYGEILPISDLAQKGAILVALIGQFYTVILTAIVVGKYLNQKS